MNKRISTHVFTNNGGMAFSGGRMYNFPIVITNVIGWRVANVFIGDYPGIATTSAYVICSSLCPSELLSTINGVYNNVIYCLPSNFVNNSVYSYHNEGSWNIWIKRDITTIDFVIKNQDGIIINCPFVIVLEFDQEY